MSRTDQIKRYYEPLLEGAEAATGSVLQWIQETGDFMITENGDAITFESTATVDDVPDLFVFTNLTNVQKNTMYSSNVVTITGINVDATISVAGGNYKINDGNWTANDGFVAKNDQVQVQVMSSNNDNTTVTVILTVGGVSQVWTVTTAAAPVDTTPDAFAFTDVTNADINTQYTSNAITVSGINSPTPIALSSTIPDAEYQIDNGAWTNAPGNVTVNQQVKVRFTTSDVYEQVHDATITIGGVSDTYRATTKVSPPPPDATPDAFAFTGVVDASLSTVYASEEVVISGTNMPAAVTITGGSYSIDGGAYASGPTTINSGQRIKVRGTSSANHNTLVSVALTIGGVVGTFDITTAAAPGGDITPLNDPDWLIDAEDYTGTKVGSTGYSLSDYSTILSHANPVVVTDNTTLYAAIAAAKSDTSIKAIHLTPGPVYTWTKNLIGNHQRPANDPLVISTLPGATIQAQVSQILEEQACQGIAFVDLDVSSGIVLQLANKKYILLEKLKGFITLQGERLPNAVPGLPMEDVQIRQCHLVDHWGTGSSLTHGLFTWNVNRLLVEGCFVDHNGWDPAHDRFYASDLGGPSSRDHNMYINRPAGVGTDMAIVRYCIIARASSHGCQGKAPTQCYHNLFLRNPVCWQLGYGGDGQFGSLGTTNGSVMRDNIIVDADRLDASGGRGDVAWVTCVDQAVVANNLAIDYDPALPTSNAAFVYLEQNFPITVNVSNNKAWQWPQSYLYRSSGYTPNVTDSGNNWALASFDAGALALARTLKSDAWLDNHKATRTRLGVDIEELKANMAAIRAGAP
jgi:hypothetical protein